MTRTLAITPKLPRKPKLAGTLRLAVVGSLALLTACHSTPTRLFALYGVDSTAAQVPYSGPPVRVDTVHVPPTLDRTEVVRDTGGGEVRIDDLDQWSAPLGQMARQTLSADLLTRLPHGRVIFPHLAKPEGARGITVDLLELETAGGELRLRASWAVTPPSAAVTPTLADLHTASSGGAAATVRALSTLLGQLADRIAASL